MTIEQWISLLTVVSTLVLGVLTLRNQKRQADSESTASEATAADQIASTAVNVLLEPLKKEISELRKRVEILERIEAAYRYLRGEALKNDMPMAVEIANGIASGKRVFTGSQ